jgi:hypothetical protein
MKNKEIDWNGFYNWLQNKNINELIIIKLKELVERDKPKKVGVEVIPFE